MTKRHELLLKVLYNIPESLVNIIYFYDPDFTLRYIKCINTGINYYIVGHNNEILYLFNPRLIKVYALNTINDTLRELKLNIRIRNNIKILFTKNNGVFIWNYDTTKLYTCPNLDKDVIVLTEIKLKSKLHIIDMRCSHKNDIYMANLCNDVYKLNTSTNKATKLFKMPEPMKKIIVYKNIIYCLGDKCIYSYSDSKLLSTFRFGYNGIYDFFVFNSEYYLVRQKEVLVYSLSEVYKKTIDTKELDTSFNFTIKNGRNVFFSEFSSHQKAWKYSLRELY